MEAVRRVNLMAFAASPAMKNCRRPLALLAEIRTKRFSSPPGDVRYRQVPYRVPCRTLSVRDHLEQILSRLDARRENEKAYVKLYADSARIEADAADRRRQAGATLGPLDGKIVSIKDLFDVAGEPTLAGSIIRRTAAVPQQDAVVVRRLRAAGAVIVGKTHMTEFAFTAVGLNPHYPVPGNATDESLIPGGSSSGAAVSAAEGTCDIAIGSDTGGSVRIPAALNGLVGFKPTASRVSLDGAFPLAPSSRFDRAARPHGQRLRSCRCRHGRRAGNGACAPADCRPADRRATRPAPGRRSRPKLPTHFAACLDRLTAAGAELVDCGIDDLIDRLKKATAIGSIAGLEASRVHADWLS